jgi:hypothetical protein
MARMKQFYEEDDIDDAADDYYFYDMWLKEQFKKRIEQTQNP